MNTVEFAQKALVRVSRSELLEAGFARLFSVPGLVVYGHTTNPERYATIDNDARVAYCDAETVEEMMRRG